MAGIVLMVLAVVALAALVLITRGANHLFTANVKNGRITSVRGRAPKGLLRDIGDIVRHRPVEAANIRVVVRDRAPALEDAQGLTDNEAQRLRNVLGGWPLARIRATPPRSR